MSAKFGADIVFGICLEIRHADCEWDEMAKRLGFDCEKLEEVLYERLESYCKGSNM